MAAKKGLIAKAKDAIAGVFDDKPARKSPKRVAAGKKAATTRSMNTAVKSVKSGAKKVARKVTGATKTAKKATRKRSTT